MSMDDPTDMGQSNSKSAGNEAPKEMGVTMLLSALEYVSHKLWQKTKTHHTLVVSGGVVFVLLFRSRPSTEDISVLQASHLDAKTKTVLVAAINRAAEKHSLSKSWLNNSAEKDISAEDLEAVISRSLAQKETVFSSEGLSLIAVDFYYALKKMLLDLSKALEEGELQHSAPNTPSIDIEGTEGDPQSAAPHKHVVLRDMVQLLRRLVSVENRGKTVERAEIDEVYPDLRVTDEAIEFLQRAYNAKFGERGIVAGKLSDDEHLYEETEGLGDNVDVIEASASSAMV